ncbi:MAG: glycosyltransferase [Cyanobacteriota bacterium]|nr:glycosyltransferase [Cyanobacteriota bacterium]
MKHTVSSIKVREGPTSQNRLSIFLPTLNEGGSIRHVIESLLHLGTNLPLEILGADDDSHDGAPDPLRALAQADDEYWP